MKKRKRESGNWEKRKRRGSREKRGRREKSRWRKEGGRRGGGAGHHPSRTHTRADAQRVYCCDTCTQ